MSAIVGRRTFEELEQRYSASLGVLPSLPEVVLKALATLQASTVSLDDSSSSSSHSSSSSSFRQAAPNTVVRNRFRNNNNNGNNNNSNNNSSAPTRYAAKEVSMRNPVSATDKLLLDIRNVVNKLSPANLERQQPKLADLVVQYAQSLLVEQQQQQQQQQDEVLARLLFSLMSVNSLQGSMFADVYASLLSLVPALGCWHLWCTRDALVALPAVPYAEPDVDYDGFCKYTKTMDQRKAATAFVCALYHKGVLPVVFIESMLAHFVGEIQRCTTDPGDTEQVDQATEHVFLLLQARQPWPAEVETMVKTFADAKPKQIPGLDARSIFKYRDLYAALTK